MRLVRVILVIDSPVELRSLPIEWENKQVYDACKNKISSSRNERVAPSKTYLRAEVVRRVMAMAMLRLKERSMVHANPWPVKRLFRYLKEKGILD